MGTPAGRYRIEAMREAVRRYGSRTVGALRPLTARARSLAERLGARALALARGWWRDRDRLLDQGDAWVRRHTQGLTQAQLDEAYGDAETKLPEGMTIPLAGDAGR